MKHWPRTALPGIVLLVIVFAGAGAPKEADDTAKSIEGTYLLYQGNNQNGNLICKMAITARDGKGFMAFGLDQAWSGEGRLEGNMGYYHWVFANGSRGKSTFTINEDGTLTGKVEGEIAPWTYRARRSKDKAEGQ
jgi:hypothetical protein